MTNEQRRALGAIVCWLVVAPLVPGVVFWAMRTLGLWDIAFTFWTWCAFMALWSAMSLVIYGLIPKRYPPTVNVVNQLSPRAPAPSETLRKPEPLPWNRKR